ncbi:MAG: helix-turn-helix domain-containing protein [Candidatus Cryptobacteroides sp.]
MNLYIWASCFAYVLAGVFCAILRWCHMCHPYDRYKHYFYPSRKTVTILFLLTLIQIPYLMHPESEDAWLLERCFLVIYAPTFGSISHRSFFFRDLRQWFRKKFWTILLPALMIIVLIINALGGGNELEPYKFMICISSLIFSAIIAVNLIVVFIRIVGKIRMTNREEYSNEEDFPAQFGFATSIGALVVWILAVIVFLIGNQTITAIYNNLAAIASIILLITILNPLQSKCEWIDEEIIRIIEAKRAQALGDTKEEQEVASSDIPSQQKKDIERKIRKVVIEEKQYLNPKFNKTELVTLVGTNRTYLSIVLRENFGSFYSFINKLRIEHAAEYSKEHPTATNSEIASNSGFGSVRTYTRVRHLYETKEL